MPNDSVMDLVFERVAARSQVLIEALEHARIPGNPVTALALLNLAVVLFIQSGMGREGVVTLLSETGKNLPTDAQIAAFLLQFSSTNTEGQA